MSTRFMLRMAAPMVGVSLLLLAVGVVAAWYIHHLQRGHSELLASDVSSMLAAEKLEIEMREVRNKLNRFLRGREQKWLDQIPALRQNTRDLLDEARSLARSSEEQELVAKVDQGCEHFFSETDRLTEPMALGEKLDEVGLLVDRLMQKEIFTPAREYVELHQRSVVRSSEQTQLWANRMGLGLLLLGICGAAGGLLAGLGIARGVTRSIVQLSVSVRGAAGKLNEVVGPVTLPAGGGFKELEQALRHMTEQVATVVERLEQREREVLRGEQLAAVGQLAAGIAHELRNPLMAIKILVQAAADRGDGDGLKGRDLMVVNEEIVRLESSIQELLDFARPPQLAKSTFDVRSLVTQTVELISARAEQRRVAIRCELPERAAAVEADGGQIRQVVLNLLLNALDALPDGGEVKVKLSGDAADADWFTLRVADTGTGLSPELGDRIFDPFVSAKETGTGLGLSICRRIVEAHGGSIVAHNLPEKGAEFVVRLPLAALPQPALAPSARELQLGAF